MKKNIFYITILVTSCLSLSSFAKNSNNYKITNESIGDIKLGMSYQEAINKLKNTDYRFDEWTLDIVGFNKSNPQKIDIQFSGDTPPNNLKLIEIYRKTKDIKSISNLVSQNKIDFIKTCNSNYKVKEGWGIDSNIYDVIKKHKDFEIKYSYSSKSETMYLPEYPNLFLSLIPKNKNSMIGKYEGYNNNTKNIENIGTVDCIGLYIR